MLCFSKKPPLPLRRSDLMARLFIGVDIPSNIASALRPLQAGVRGAKWRTEENCHLTLRFIGEINSSLERDIDIALGQISAPAFTLRLKGVGVFGKRRPRSLWAGIEGEGALMRLAAKIETTLQKIGIEPERRKYSPHVTLTYLSGARPAMVNDYLAAHTGFQSAAFDVTEFILYESFTGKGASHYVKRWTYDLIEHAHIAE